MSVPYQPLAIEDYALIGDCRTAALVGRNGSIDWLCWPHFDSDACLAALLGTGEHGRWLLTCTDAEARATRRYRDDTLILETIYRNADGEVAVIDFMPVDPLNHSIVRRVEGRRGRMAMHMELTLRFEYGSVTPWVTRLPDGQGLQAVAGPNRVALRTKVEVRGEDKSSVAAFDVGAGETETFVMTWGRSHEPTPPEIAPEAALEATYAFWSEWAARCTYRGRSCEAVMRSLLTLKALSFTPTGAIVAAPTTSLPEQLGGSRNWDYRYCWLRDSTLTLIALITGGYLDEAQAWVAWLHRAAAGDPAQVQIMYGLGGERRLLEWTVPWLPGYQGASPVRVGNAASGQLHLDTYGEVMGALSVGRRAGLIVPEAGWALQRALVEHLTTVWEQPDDGIWEVRGGRRHFTHSKVMAWFAIDRAIADAQDYGLEAPLERWRALRDRMHALICDKGFDPARNSFTQSFGHPAIDASLLLIPRIGFLPADDPRVLGTILAVEQDLLVDGFVLRYRTEDGVDGLPPGEGAFLPCSFWLASVYREVGRHEDAEALFNRLLALRNDVGLLAEEYDPRAGRQVGNFPQAYSHLSLVNAALILDESLNLGADAVEEGVALATR
jgi:GH15 family glucan-1,4-alpha-glucosidase